MMWMDTEEREEIMNNVGWETMGFKTQEEHGGRTLLLMQWWETEWVLM